jgi:HTH-type transcriptional regulator, sugar sensing transcriptional regulator
VSFRWSNRLILSDSEISAYLSLLEHHPVNGSQLSRSSGVPRARIYDVLQSLKRKDLIADLGDGLYEPLPPNELLRRLKTQYQTELDDLETQIKEVTQRVSYEYIWTIRGYDEVMEKIKEMIGSASDELYVLFYPREAQTVDPWLKAAEDRGVEVKYVSMGPPVTKFEIQVVHPEAEAARRLQNGRVFDVVVDRIEVLVGLFEEAREDESPINWGKNHWMVQAVREGIRHDFFHAYMHKLCDLGQPLTDDEQRIYDIIKRDTWAYTGLRGNRLRRPIKSA